MSQYLVTPSINEDDRYAFFAINGDLGSPNSKTYQSVEEAKDAPLVQQMFYLPFVKSVRLLPNGVEIERFDILAWKDVIDEVAKEIQSYLNNGGIIHHSIDVKKVPITLYAESTPNPNVMKFVANKRLVDTIVEIKHKEEAAAVPLAESLFTYPFVRELFLDENYISITKNETVEWDSIVIELREFIRSYLEEGKEILSDQYHKRIASSTTNVPIESLDETSQEIVKIIDEYIKPAVASDGGNILFDKYNPEDKSVHVILQGACSGCPSSTITLKNGIETMLQEILPGKISTVMALNG